MIRPEEIFNSIEPIEQKIRSRGIVLPFEDQWNFELSPMKASIRETITYPNDEEQSGSVYISWRGPNPILEQENVTACIILLKYLCCGTMSPLQRELLEVPEPFASHICFQIIEHAEVMLLIKLNGVNMEKINEVDNKVMEILKSIVQKEEKFDMKRLEVVIQSDFTEELNSLDREPHLHIFNKILPTLIYAPKDEDDETLQARFLLDNIIVEMLAKDEDAWLEFLNKYFVEGNHVTIEAVPKIEKLQQMIESEHQRLEDIKENLSETALEMNQAELDEAITQNDEAPPDEMITAAQLLASAEVHYLFAVRYCSSKQTTPPGINLQKMPVYSEVYDLATNFTYCTVTFNTDCVPTELRLYLPLFIELLLNSPIEIDDELMPLQDISAEMEKDLISIQACIGIQDEGNNSFYPYSNHFMIMMQIEMEDYEKGIIWLDNILHKTRFLPERIKINATKLLNTVIEMKRDENLVSRQLLDAMFYDPTSNIRLHSVIKQRQFLNEILGKIEDPDMATGVIEHLNFLRDIVTNPTNNIAIHIATDWSKLSALGKNLNAPWNEMFPCIDLDDVPKRLHVLPDFVFFELLPLEEGCNGVIVGRRSAKSTYLYQAVRCVNDYRDLELPALTVFLQYLTQPEGAIWRSLRGRGLAYDYSMNVYPNEGLLKLSICQSNDIVAAYRVMKNIIEKHLTDTVEWNESLVESAKSTSIYNAVNTEGTIAQLVMRSVLAGFQEVPYDWNKVFIKVSN